MRLCQLCQSIPFKALPSFPLDDYMTGLTGKKYIHRFVRKPGDGSSDADADAAAAAEQEAQRIKHHANINALREAAAGGCELCALIQAEADAMLAEIEGLGEEGSRERNMYPVPSFNMWLTQRPEGGRGFWVLSGPSGDVASAAYRRLVLPVAAFGIVVDEDDPFANTIRGRPVKPTVDAAVFQRIQRSITECDNDHDDCHQLPKPVPRLLLDLHASDAASNEFVRLVELGDKRQEKYAALSYASDSGIVRRQDTNTPADGENIVVTGLSKTFQDAIGVTRALGIQYLWIDSLCIPGNLAEWKRSSLEAGAVYSNAYVTISATGATNPLGGLFLPRQEPKYAQIGYTSDDGRAGSVLVSSLPLAKEVLRTAYVEMRHEPISTQVWSFQERVLSPRVVHFASDQVYVECMRQFVSEDGLLEKLRYHTTAETLPAGTRDYHLQSLTRSPTARWFSMIWDYARREAADPQDKLTALTNVARGFHRMMDGDGGEYIAGHWRESLVESLCWQSLRCKPAGDSAAPSWSWASVNGIPALGFGESVPDRYFATVVDIKVDLADAANPFGRVTAAAITLEAPLLPLRLVEAESAAAGIHLRTESGDEEGFFACLDLMERRYAASADAVRSMSLFALVLVRTRWEGECVGGQCRSPDGILRGLIVTPAVDGGMRRVGFLLASQDELGPASALDSTEVVKLV